ncbi:hypothetical protein TNCV_2264501 [Trichonephila clavipes]|nr:hypothetical protein TNCV_2264501 [Trichonephila clavipes]
MDACKFIVPSRYGGTLNSRRAASPLVRLVEGEERWEAFDPPTGCSSSKLGWNRAKTSWRHGTTPLRVKEDIEDVSSELGNGGNRLHLDETFRTLLLLATKTSEQVESSTDPSPVILCDYVQSGCEICSQASFGGTDELRLSVPQYLLDTINTEPGFLRLVALPEK